MRKLFNKYEKTIGKLWKKYYQPYTGNEIKTKPIFFKPFC